MAAIDVWHGPGETPGNFDRLFQLSGKIGEALIVAAALAFVVDKAAKSKLLEEFAMDISSHIIGRSLPPELRKPIEEYLRSLPLDTLLKRVCFLPLAVPK